MKYPPLEARLSSFEHPNIVNVLEVIEGRHGEHILLVQECLLGGDLFTCMQQAGIFSELLARCMFTDLLRGVEYLHHQGVIHRDLKSENCVLDAVGTLKIIDFGLASYYTHGMLFSDFCGSPEYAAPEIHRGCPYEGPPADLWAMGVILYDMVVGDLPFSTGCESYSLPEIALETLSNELYQLLSSLLRESPYERASVAALLDCPWMKLRVRTFGSSNVEIVASSVSCSASGSSPMSVEADSPLHVRLVAERQRVLEMEMGFGTQSSPRRSLFKPAPLNWDN